MLVRICLLALASSMLLSAGQLRAQDLESIRSRSQEFVKAVSDAKPAEIVAFWTPTGEYTRDDLTISGRDNIQKAYEEYFKSRQPGTVNFQDDAVRFLSKGVAIHEGTFVIKHKNPADDSFSRFSILYITTADGWMIGQMREVPGGPSVAELAWMIGIWKLRVGEANITMSIRLNKAKTFMIVETTTETGAGGDTQLIGVDPATGGLKSWSFESDGSIGTSEWVRTEKGWVANVTATTAVGEQVKALTTITPTGRDTFTFRISERSVNGVTVPNVGPVTVTRAPEKR